MSHVLWILLLLEPGHLPRPAVNATPFQHRDECVARGKEILNDIELFSRVGYRVMCVKMQRYNAVNINV